ncbi:MAG: hypothetical protein HHJ17_14000 [Rhodoferax sp.]|uniref:hypothetical protein n=1 Tax=Rhodoferax sp. TaxID=50421 RepID=UPI0018434842|nr:hypothetical protein [Rhodoferax sp.]NMM14630.1 hypothetical protein [Rhodoferax sp.]
MRLNSYLPTQVDAEKRMDQLLPFSLDELQQGQVPIVGLTDLRWRGLHKWTRLAGAAASPAGAG